MYKIQILFLPLQYRTITTDRYGNSKMSIRHGLSP
nr:MAG TPA: hypothetical protein [Crassvirales sp.]